MRCSSVACGGGAGALRAARRVVANCGDMGFVSSPGADTAAVSTDASSAAAGGALSAARRVVANCGDMGCVSTASAEM